MKQMIISRRTFLSTLLGTVGVAAAGGPALAATAEGVRLLKGYVEWREQAAGVYTLRPRLHWTLRSGSSARNKTQTAVRVRIADHKGVTQFDSGKVATAKLQYTPPADLSLLPQRRYEWYLTVWDENQKPSAEVHA